MLVSVLTCKSIVKLGYRGVRLIEPSSSWFPPKFPFGLLGFFCCFFWFCVCFVVFGVFCFGFFFFFFFGLFFGFSFLRHEGSMRVPCGPFLVSRTGDEGCS